MEEIANLANSVLDYCRTIHLIQVRGVVINFFNVCAVNHGLPSAPTSVKNYRKLLQQLSVHYRAADLTRAASFYVPILSK